MTDDRSQLHELVVDTVLRWGSSPEAVTDAVWRAGWRPLTKLRAEVERLLRDAETNGFGDLGAGREFAYEQVLDLINALSGGSRMRERCGTCQGEGVVWIAPSTDKPGGQGYLSRSCPDCDGEFHPDDAWEKWLRDERVRELGQSEAVLSREELVAKVEAMPSMAVGPEPEIPVTEGTPLSEYRRVQPTDRVRREGDT